MFYQITIFSIKKTNEKIKTISNIRLKNYKIITVFLTIKNNIKKSRFFLKRFFIY